MSQICRRSSFGTLAFPIRDAFVVFSIEDVLSRSLRVVKQKTWSFWGLLVDALIGYLHV